MTASTLPTGPPCLGTLPVMLLGRLLGKAIVFLVARDLTPTADDRECKMGSSSRRGLDLDTSINVALLGPEDAFQLLHGDVVKEGE